VSANDKVFAGSVPELYERYMVPLIFEPYAQDIARRLAPRNPRQVLEIAAGTGVVTRALAAALPKDTAIIATDLNPAMIERARQVPIARPVEWRQADALALPFDDGSFDAVVCQFGVMFFPDRARGFAEMRRVLRPGGLALVSAWDRIEDNDFAAAISDALASLFPADPPRFMSRTPHGYHDVEAIRRDVAAGGFDKEVKIDTVAARSRAPNARDPAIAYCQGTPWRGEIEARDANGLANATDVAAREMARRFGNGPVDGKIQAFVIEATR
jgi:ubiquinone/menaquinone biosynthesis C-methylase UbiE